MGGLWPSGDFSHHYKEFQTQVHILNDLLVQLLGTDNSD
jgi:hypothetical protein